jgi:predicted 2-oxoglutarate/Fe(II)-dependent dioxygenase YbiX
MNINLLNNNYLIIPNFINSHRAEELGKEFKIYSESQNNGGDSQAPNSQSEYNYISFLELLCEKTQQVSSILEETVLPTYAYSRVYYNGSVLNRHRDRDACEISLTLHLDGDKSWPIYIETPDGREKSVILEPGDAMMYLGKVADHWRNEYNGDYYTQVFLHYVRSRGDCAYAYFDKCKDDSEKTEKKDIIENKLSPEHELIIESQQSPMLVIPKPSNTLEQYIHVFEGIVPEELCDEILSEYDENNGENNWQHTMVGQGEIVKDIRNCKQILISDPGVIQKNYHKRKTIDERLHESIRNVIIKYTDIHKDFRINVDTGYGLLKYEEGNYYIEHTDSFKEEQRSLSCSLQLNEDYVGGEFAFFGREMMIKSSKGSAIVFPSNFMYPHEIMPVIQGTRYSIITWLV